MLWKTASILCFVLVLTGCRFGPSAEDGPLRVYVSVDGDDASPGTRSAPVASLTGARDAVRRSRRDRGWEGAIDVVVADGRYRMREPLVLEAEDGGRQGAPVRYRAAEGAHPVFEGGETLDPPSVGPAGAWTFRVPPRFRPGADNHVGFEQLYVGGRRAVRARSPNQGWSELTGVRQTIHEKGDGRVPLRATQELELPDEDLAALARLDPAELARTQIQLFHKWDHTRKFLAGIDAATSSVTIGGRGMKPWNSLKKGTRYRLENHPAGLDSPGEWYMDGEGSLRYLPREDEDPETARVVVPELERFIEIRGRPDEGVFVDHVEFHGLTFRYGAYITPPGGFEPKQAAASIDAVILMDGARHITIQECEIAHIGRYAVWFRRGCRSGVLRRSVLRDLGAGGVRIGETVEPDAPGFVTREILVEDNVIRAGGRFFPCAVGVWIGHSPDNRILHNEVSDFFYTGVSVGWRWGYEESVAKRNVISFNHIHDIGQGVLSDMAGVYTLGPSEGTRVTHNHIHHVDSHTYGGWGLYTDEGSSGILMSHNLVHDVETGGFHQHYGRDNRITNNILAFSRLHQVQCTRAEKHLSFRFDHNLVIFNEGALLKGRWLKARVEMDHNCYWNVAGRPFDFAGRDFAAWQALGRDRNSVIADPGFRDPANRDFLFRSDARALELGFQPFDPGRAGPRRESAPGCAVQQRTRTP